MADPNDSDDESETIQSIVDDEENDRSRTKKGKQNFITQRIVAALDSAKVSDRNAVHILTAVAVALGHDVKELILNRSTIRRVRQKMRREEYEKVKENFVDRVSE